MAPIAIPDIYEGLEPTSSVQQAGVLGFLPHQVFIFILAAFVLSVAGIWYTNRVRRDLHLRQSTTEYLILESEVTIDIGDDGFDIEYETDDEDRKFFFESMMSPTTPRSITLDINKLSSLHIRRRDSSILERRGRKTLVLQAAEGMDADMALLDIQNGRLTVSPISTRPDGRYIRTQFHGRGRSPQGAENRDEKMYGLASGPYTLQSSWRSIVKQSEAHDQ